VFVVPETLRGMPRWWSEGSAWLDSLPERAAVQMSSWGLTLDGSVPLRHGSNALAVPVIRDGEPLVLRLTPPGSGVAEEVAALRFWRGRGVVELVAADVAMGATLLERLDGSRSAADLPLEEGVTVVARLMRRLGVEPPEDAPRTCDVVRERLAELDPEWKSLGRPFPRRTLAAVMTASQPLTVCAEDVAVNADLHGQQVLAGRREPWLCVDPRLMRGEVAFDLARVLWTRLDEMPHEDAIRRNFRSAIDAAGLDPERARAWVVYRAADYWLWGLRHGLSEDPRRCERLLTVLGAHRV
jgi:streptomycin 6-kinase